MPDAFFFSRASARPHACQSKAFSHRRRSILTPQEWRPPFLGQTAWNLSGNNFAVVQGLRSLGTGDDRSFSGTRFCRTAAVATPTFRFRSALLTVDPVAVPPGPSFFVFFSLQGLKKGAPWPFQSAFYGSAFFNVMVYDPNVGP